jgi:hypothetical protein
VLQSIFGFIMSGCYTHLKRHIAGFAVIYGIFLSFGELGPGNCLGLLAAKSAPTAIRGQYYGAAAAIGKVGAFAGTWGTFCPLIGLSSMLTRWSYLKRSLQSSTVCGVIFI